MARIDVYLHVADSTLSRIEQKLDLIIQKEIQMAGELDTLTAQVKANTDAEASAITLIEGLKTALDAAIASGNPAALTALSAQLSASKDALAAAILANTPAAP